MKVLVTGSEGFVGRHVVDYLSKHGHQPIGTDVAGGQNKGSVADRPFVMETLGTLDFQAVVHLAGIADLKKTIEDPYNCYQVNCFGTLNMLELALRKGVRRFIFASSANVYGVPKKLPVNEDAPLDPRVPYDYSKVVGEAFVMSYHRTKKLPVAITRAWLLFGEHDIPNRAVPRFVGACLRNEPINLFNSGRDTTAPSHALNYAGFVKSLLENDGAVGETFNFGGKEILSIRELAERIKKLTGSRSQLVMLPPRSEMEKEPQVSYPSIERMKKLGYKEELTLDEGLRRTIDWIERSAGKG